MLPGVDNWKPRRSKKLFKSLQKGLRERLGERSEPQDAPGEPLTTKNNKNMLVSHHLNAKKTNLSWHRNGKRAFVLEQKKNASFFQGIFWGGGKRRKGIMSLCSLEEEEEEEGHKKKI